MANYADQDFLKEALDASSHTELRIGIATAKWNSEITQKLKEGALRTLRQAGIPDDRIHIMDVPGTFELIHAGNMLLNQGCDAVLCLGVVIQGETRHFDFICSAVSNGLAQLTIKHNKPAIFGVLTTENRVQALERSGGSHGHKGEEAAHTALQLLL